MRVLRKKMAGDDVRKWQEFLLSKGFDPNGTDGVFGPGTEAASIAFQKANGLKGDGIIGNDTFAVAMAQGYALLPHHEAPAPTGNVVKVKTIADGVIIWKLSDNGAVFFTSDMDVDADGCATAYGPNNSGLDLNGNAQSPTSSGKWNPNVLVLGSDKQPIRQSNSDPAPGFFICKSSLQDKTKDVDDPRRYVDALKVPFIVLPGGSAGPAGMGDAALVIDLKTKRQIKCLVADAGPAAKTGEASIQVCGVILDDLTPKQIEAAAKKDKLKGLKCNPRNGGVGGPSNRRFRYIVFPGTTMTWPQTVSEIEARVDGALARLTPEQIIAITT